MRTLSTLRRSNGPGNLLDASASRSWAPLCLRTEEAGVAWVRRWVLPTGITRLSVLPVFSVFSVPVEQRFHPFASNAPESRRRFAARGGERNRSR